eukprot:Skav220096  [mRNA]  locus=scaffold1991:68070:72579:+ [translate_table: standard]
MNVASWSLDLNYEGKCVSLRGGYNLLGIVNYACLFACCGLVVSSICVILWNHGSDICSGKYLATKWNFERTRLFQCLAVLLLLIVVVTFIVTAIVSGTTLKTEEFSQLLQAWFLYGSLAWIVTLFSAYALLPSWSPRFDYGNEDFQRLRFRRTWRHVFWVSSQDARDKSHIDHPTAEGAEGAGQELQVPWIGPRLCRFHGWPDHQAGTVWRQCNSVFAPKLTSWHIVISAQIQKLRKSTALHWSYARDDRSIQVLCNSGINLRRRQSVPVQGAQFDATITVVATAQTMEYESVEWEASLKDTEGVPLDKP